jgi:hypothetical protein
MRGFYELVGDAGQGGNNQDDRFLPAFNDGFDFK